MSKDDPKTRDANAPVTRRTILIHALRGAGAVGVLGLAAGAVRRFRGAANPQTVWQIDPIRCTQCGQCAVNCVLAPSAVKCIHSYAMCGYCRLCTGFFDPQPNALNTGAENQLCPLGAIKRTYVEDPYFEYTIDTDLCIGCGKCVEGCEKAGNGSLYLQIQHDRCANCNECAIAAACPSGAITRIPADQPYLLKIRPEKKEE
jgi:electron transport complex protein RnfB